VSHFVPLFAYEHLPADLRVVSSRFAALAEFMVSHLKDGPELTSCLRKILEAKDCAVRQAVIDRQPE
jgi:hypothetical protein